MQLLDRLKLRRGADGEKGFIMVVTAIVMTMMLLFAGLAVDVSSWNERAAEIKRASDAAALAGVVWMPDFNKAQSVALETAQKNGFTNGVNNVTVYKVTDPNGAIPTGCSGSNPSSQTGLCNVYTGTQLANLQQSAFTGTTSCGTTAPDKAWCPTTRQNVQHLGTDYVGVWVKANTPSITGFFGHLVGMESAAVMRIEPA